VDALIGYRKRLYTHKRHDSRHLLLDHGLCKKRKENLVIDAGVALMIMKHALDGLPCSEDA
jgi:hypothetical protein